MQHDLCNISQDLTLGQITMEETIQESLQVKKCPRFNTRLRHYVENHGIRLSWIAKMASMSYYRLYRLYSGASEPTVKEAHALAQVLNSQIEELFELEEPAEVEGND